MLDGSGVGAYSRRVTSRRVTAPPAASDSQAQGPGRRRPSNAKETARRKAWGKQWGKLNSEAAKRIKAEGE